MTPNETGDDRDDGHDHDHDHDAHSDAAVDTDPDDSDRVATLEAAVEDLRDTVKRQQRTISYLVADADIEGLEPTCPNCGAQSLTVDSGLTWRSIACSECGLQEYL